MKSYIFFSSLTLLTVPFLVGAAGLLTGVTTDVSKPFIGATKLINNFLVPLLLAAAFLMFVYGVFMFFVVGGSDPEKRKDGRSLVIYSIIGFALIFALWGIVGFVVNSVFGGSGSAIDVPALPTVEASTIIST